MARISSQDTARAPQSPTRVTLPQSSQSQPPSPTKGPSLNSNANFSVQSHSGQPHQIPSKVEKFHPETVDSSDRRSFESLDEISSNWQKPPISQSYNKPKLNISTSRSINSSSHAKKSPQNSRSPGASGKSPSALSPYATIPFKPHPPRQPTAPMKRNSTVSKPSPNRGARTLKVTNAATSPKSPNGIATVPSINLKRPSTTAPKAPKTPKITNHQTSPDASHFPVMTVTKGPLFDSPMTSTESFAVHTIESSAYTINTAKDSFMSVNTADGSQFTVHTTSDNSGRSTPTIRSSYNPPATKRRDINGMIEEIDETEGEYEYDDFETIEEHHFGGSYGDESRDTFEMFLPGIGESLTHILPGDQFDNYSENMSYNEPFENDSDVHAENYSTIRKMEQNEDHFGNSNLSDIEAETDFFGQHDDYEDDFLVNVFKNANKGRKEEEEAPGHKRPPWRPNSLIWKNGFEPPPVIAPIAKERSLRIRAYASPRSQSPTKTRALDSVPRPPWRGCSGRKLHEAKAGLEEEQRNRSLRVTCNQFNARTRSSHRTRSLSTSPTSRKRSRNSSLKRILESHRTFSNMPQPKGSRSRSLLRPGEIEESAADRVRKEMRAQSQTRRIHRGNWTMSGSRFVSQVKQPAWAAPLAVRPPPPPKPKKQKPKPKFLHRGLGKTNNQLQYFIEKLAALTKRLGSSKTPDHVQLLLEQSRFWVEKGDLREALRVAAAAKSIVNSLVEEDEDRTLCHYDFSLISDIAEQSHNALKRGEYVSPFRITKLDVILHLEAKVDKVISAIVDARVKEFTSDLDLPEWEDCEDSFDGASVPSSVYRDIVDDSEAESEHGFEDRESEHSHQDRGLDSANEGGFWTESEMSESVRGVPLSHEYDDGSARYSIASSAPTRDSYAGHSERHADRSLAFDSIDEAIFESESSLATLNSKVTSESYGSLLSSNHDFQSHEGDKLTERDFKVEARNLETIFEMHANRSSVVDGKNPPRNETQERRSYGDLRYASDKPSEGARREQSMSIPPQTDAHRSAESIRNSLPRIDTRENDNVVNKPRDQQSDLSSNGKSLESTSKSELTRNEAGLATSEQKPAQSPGGSGTALKEDQSDIRPLDSHSIPPVKAIATQAAPSELEANAQMEGATPNPTPSNHPDQKKDTKSSPAPASEGELPPIHTSSASPAK
ncbi:hypothetical protein HDU97_006668 [Phlyctochytrium planicorne]|nr:hypothetical protein HDU97_006668 [Phlyctochytrium planicorne]